MKAKAKTNGMNGAVATRSTPPPASPPVAAKKKPVITAESLTKRKTMLQARRWKIVLDELLEAIKQSTEKEVTVDLVDLVTIFGTDFRRTPVNGTIKRGSLWRVLDNARKAGYPVEGEVKENSYGFSFSRRALKVAGDSRDAALWKALKPVVSDQLRGWHNITEIVTSNVVEDIRRVGKLIAFPVEARKGTADFTLRVPRTWGKGLDPHTLEKAA